MNFLDPKISQKKSHALEIRSLTERQRMSGRGGPNHRNETQVVFRFHVPILSFGEPIGSLGLD